MPLLYDYHVLCIRTVAFPDENVVGDALHMYRILSSPRSSQPTLTSGLICGIKVEAITFCSVEAFLLTCWDSGRRMFDSSRPESCVWFSSPLHRAFCMLRTYSYKQRKKG